MVYFLTVLNDVYKVKKINGLSENFNSLFAVLIRPKQIYLHNILLINLFELIKYHKVELTRN